MQKSDSVLENNTKCGVALLFFKDENLLYCVRELLTKECIGKQAGDLSFPWETQEEGETDQETLERLLKEEVYGEAPVEMSQPLFLGSFTVVPGTLARVYSARFLSGPEELVGTHAGKEIEFVGWQTKEFLLSHCRKGVREALELFEHFQEKEVIFD